MRSSPPWVWSAPLAARISATSSGGSSNAVPSTSTNAFSPVEMKVVSARSAPAICV
jgi:hypothetical protein